MVVVCDRPSAKPSTDIATIIGAMLLLTARTSRQRRRDDRRDHCEPQVRDPADEERRRGPRQQGAAGADAKQNADLRGRQPDDHAEQRHVDQSRSTPLFAEKLVISAAGIPHLRSRPHTRSALPSRTVDGCMRVRMRDSGGGQTRDEDPRRDQQGRGRRWKARAVRCGR